MLLLLLMQVATSTASFSICMMCNFQNLAVPYEALEDLCMKSLVS